MKYELPVYTTEELAKASGYPPLERGTYRFKVISRIEGTSKEGYPQEQLILEVYHNQQRPMRCYNNFTFKPADHDNHMFLIKLATDFLECIGVEYTKDAFNRVLNREGKAIFEVAEYTNKKGDKKEKFVVPIEGFLAPGEMKSEISAPPSRTKKADPSSLIDDDIPF